jgi:3',5'-nucleoside bisphosphate phosphatase
VKADLHLHTTASDGRLQPEEIVSLAISVGLDVIAVTDHDTVDGITRALAAAQSNSLTVIPGVEISTDVAKGEVHILGYFIDYTDKELAATLQKLRDSRRERARKMVAKLEELGMKIDWERVSELAQGGTIGRPHISKALFEKGHVDSEREAFNKYIGHNRPAYVERYKLLPEEVVRLILDAQGLPVLAHPADIDGLDDFVPRLKAAGLVGMEVYYKDYGSETVDRLAKLARKCDLITTGGTDYHAFNDGSEVEIGGTISPAHSVKQLFALASNRSLELLNKH